MKKNVGSVDKIIRLVLAIVLFAVAYFGVIEGTLAIVSYVAGAIMLFTAFMKSCPLYSIFGISSCPLEK
ncbi:MAG: DUF2892 domain-containing protein [Flavobacteriales bacterium]|nr:DUF2892 domain-containing protein [Flavobacteriales bacterium]